MSAHLNSRSLRPAAFYRIVVLDDQLSERHVDLTDPVPTARQILQAVGFRPGDGYSVYAILTSGEFEDLLKAGVIDPAKVVRSAR